MAKKNFTQNVQNDLMNRIAEETSAEPEKLEEQQEQQEQFAQDTQEKTRKERKTYTAEEAADFIIKRKTQGRKGLRKTTRINMAFDEDVYAFIRVMAAARGENLTKFTNFIIREAMNTPEVKEIYDRAIEFTTQFKMPDEVDILKDCNK